MLVFGHKIQGVFKHYKKLSFQGVFKAAATVQVSQNLSPILKSALNPRITLIQSHIIPHQFQALSAKILLIKGFSSALEI